MRTEDSEDVLRFWFPELSGADHARMVRQFEWWFRGGGDSAISERFSVLLERATHGQLDHWAERPRSRLALIIVLDQFSRSLYRDTSRAFAQDQKALSGQERGVRSCIDTSPVFWIVSALVNRTRMRTHGLPPAPGIPRRPVGMQRAYATGDYTLSQIAEHFGVHYSTMSRAVGEECVMLQCKT